jgi:hypothetical protein
MKAGSLTIRWRYPIKTKEITQCFITNSLSGLDNIGNYDGMAICADGDHVNKEKGRKLSLARAMKKASIPKEERKVIWEIYRNTKLGGRW